MLHATDLNIKFGDNYAQTVSELHLISNLVTIAQTVSELQHFLKIQDGGVRHVGFHEKSIFHFLYW